jgi:hypothetical protein
VTGELDRDWVAALTAGTKIMFWTCLNDDHKHVTWTEDVATCDTCGLTSEMTARFARGVQKYERERISQFAITEAGRGAKTGLDRIALRAFADRLTEGDPRD